MALALGAPGLAAQESDPPEQVQELVTVTATRLPVNISELGTATTLIDAAELATRPAVGLDEALRWDPAFSLLRRTPARAAHPTTQGLNLRGIAPSGTSRALVLLDGTPATDAFGGWVYWDRVPSLAIERVEIARGGGSAPWGSTALAGALQIVTKRPGAGTGDLEARLTGGNQSTARFGLLAGRPFGAIRTMFAADLFRTGGYIAISPDERGPVDTEVATRHASGLLRIGLPGSLLASLDLLLEDRDNGTPERVNDTSAGGASLLWEPDGGARGWQAAGFARWQEFNSRFTAVASDRASEFSTLDQRVASSDFGLRGHGWGHPGSAVVSGGLDLRAVAGTSHETVLATGFQRQPGGRQQLGGLFLATSLRSGSRWALDASVRGDAWRNQPNQESSEDRSRTTVSPRLGLQYRASDNLRLRASSYGGFRAPTLNELYRQFRVGNVVTRANDELVHERLVGVEGGFAWQATSGGTQIGIEADLYYNRLRDAVINATIDATGPLIQRQRRNLGEASVTGLELRANAAWSRWQLAFAASWFRSRISAETVPTTDPGASIVGNRLPQVPEYRARASLRYTGTSGWTAVVGLLATGRQYEDDRNRLPLVAGSTLDAGLRVPLTTRAWLALQGQNLLGEPLEVARTPVLQRGPPRTVTAAVSWRLR